MEEWKAAAEYNSPQSLRQAGVLGAIAVLVMGAVFALQYVVSAAADEAAKTAPQKCRRA